MILGDIELTGILGLKNKIMSLNKCLEKYVGLTQSDCECRPENLDDFDPESSIGLYLDSEKYSVPLQFIGSKEDCDSGDLISILTGARKRGVNEFISLMSRSVKDRYGYLDLPISFFVGQNKENGSLSIPETYKGIEIRPREKYRNGITTISGIWIKGNEGEDFEIKLIRDGVEDDSVWVESYDGGKIEVQWALPSTDNGRQVAWKVIGDYPNARNIKLKPCCSGVAAWRDYIHVEGIASNNSDGSDGRHNVGYSNGIRLDASFHCGHQWLCGNNNDTDGLGRQIGEGAYLMSVIELLSFLENRPNPSTPVPIETIAMKKDQAWEQLMMRVEWIIENAGNRLSGCANCSKQRLQKASILI